MNEPGGHLCVDVGLVRQTTLPRDLSSTYSLPFAGNAPHVPL